MAGMLQILTYLLAVYLVFKGVEILQIALMSTRENRTAGLVIGVASVGVCLIAAILFSVLQDGQAQSISRSLPGFGR